MFFIWLKRGAVVLLASCVMASLTALAIDPAPADREGAVQSKDRLFKPDITLMYVNFYSTEPKADQMDPFYAAG